MKRRNLILLVLAGLLLVAVAFVATATHLSDAKPKVVTVHIDVANNALQSQYQSVINQYFTDQKLTVEFGDSNAADLVISANSSSGGIPVASDSIGQPIKLFSTSGQIVKQQDTPKFYLAATKATVSGRDSASLVNTLAAQLSQVPTGNRWTLNALGDIIEGRYVYKTMAAAGDFTLPFSKTKDQLRAADVTLADLECTLADGIPYPTMGFTFNSPAKAIAGLTESGIDAVNLANNHSYSGAASGFSQMLGNLTSAGITYFGGGKNFADAHKPEIITTHGLKIALLGYDAIPGSAEAGSASSGVAAIDIAPWFPWDEARIKQMEVDIKKAKTEADLVFVYYHWGTEYTHNANSDQRTVAHRAIDAGADVILGTHPHWVQGVEWYHGKLITYSLGNFVFDQEWSVPTTQGTMLSAAFDGTKLISASLEPYLITNFSTPGWLDGNSAMAHTILGDVYAHSWWPQ